MRSSGGYDLFAQRLRPGWNHVASEITQSPGESPARSIQPAASSMVPTGPGPVGGIRAIE